MGFFSSRKAEPTPLPLSELSGSPSGSVKVIKSRFYGKSKSTPTSTTTIANAGASSSTASASASGSNGVNVSASTSNQQPIPSSSSQPPPPRHVSTDPLTTTLAEKLNELALANADGLLDDEAHRLLRQNLFERFAQAEAQTSQTAATTTWNDAPTVSAGTLRKRFSSGFTSGNNNSNKGASWMNSNLVHSPSTITATTQSPPSKTLRRAPSMESQRSIATTVSSLFRRATRRSGSSHSRGALTSSDGMGPDDDHLHPELLYDPEQHETSSLYSRPSFSSNYRRNFPYTAGTYGGVGSMIRGVVSRQLSSDSLASVGTGVGSVSGSVAGSVAGSISVAGFPSHLQIYASHSAVGLGSGGIPPSPSSISAPIDLRTLSLSRRMQGNYASSISSRTTSRSNKPPSSFHLRHGHPTTTPTTTSANAPSSSSSHLSPGSTTTPQHSRPSISALVRERSHEDDIENDDEDGYGDTDEKKHNLLSTSNLSSSQQPPPSGPKPLKSAAALRAEIEAVEMEGRRMFDAFNALELSVLTKSGGAGRMMVHLAGSPGDGIIGTVPEETSVGVGVGIDAVSIKSAKSAKSGSGREREKDKGGSSVSTLGTSGVGTSSSMTASTSTSTSANTTSTTETTTSAATSVSLNDTSLFLPPPPTHPILHTSHSSPALSTTSSTTTMNNSASLPRSKLRLTTIATTTGTTHDNVSDNNNTNNNNSNTALPAVPAIPITPPPKKRPSILLQRRKTGKTKGVVLPPSIAAASLEIKERAEREKEERERASSSSFSSTQQQTPSTSPLVDRPSTRVRTRSHSRERPAREKPPPSLQMQASFSQPPPPPPLPPLPVLPPQPQHHHPIPTVSSLIPKSYPKHPYADTSLTLSVVIPPDSSDSQSQSHHVAHQHHHPALLSLSPSSPSPSSPPSHSLSISLSDELTLIRQRRAAVTKRYDRRLEFLRAKLKSAEIREMLK